MITEIDVGAGGTWQVSTETSTYLLDLERGQVLRRPGSVAGHHIADDGAIVVVTHLDGDDQWQPLISVIDCRVGHSLLLLRHHDHGRLVVSSSTLVQSIEVLSGATPADTGPSVQHGSGVAQGWAIAQPELDSGRRTRDDPWRVGRPATGETAGPAASLKGVLAGAEGGRFDLRILAQQEYWIDTHAVTRRLDEMSAEEVRDVLDSLRGNATGVLLGLQRQRLAALRSVISQDPIDGRLLNRAVGELRLALRLPTDWIDQTPLMGALQRRLEETGR